VIDLEALFPALRGTTYQPTSPFNDHYNCIAFALGDTTNWWWPDESDEVVWPASVPLQETIAAFEALFIGEGFEPCSDDRVEAGFVKVALFADQNSIPTHAARQLPSGVWTSKFGQEIDIEHELHAIEGDAYGRVVRFFRRPAATVTPP
jgi:hypothetical protein